MNNYGKVILKIGSALLSDEKHDAENFIKDISKQVSAAIQAGVKFAIVTSGAISQGQKILNLENKPKDLESLQALAAIGQQQLMGLYENSFKQFNTTTAQVLLTHDDMNDPNRYLNAKATITKILNLNVIPIINENDVVATEEIRFGDNDTLAAMVSNLIEADLMIILTNQDGFFTKNPDVHTDAKLIKKCNIDEIDDNEHSVNEKSEFGTGGFKTKIKAIKIATSSNTTSIVASGYKKDVVKNILEGKKVGTLFFSEK